MNSCIKKAGYKTLNEYLNDLLSTQDRKLSAVITNMLAHHGNSILGNISRRQPQLIDNYALGHIEDILAHEAQTVVESIQPSGLDLASRLQQFSLEHALYQSSVAAPHFYRLLCSLVGHLERVDSTRKKKDVVSSALCPGFQI